MMSYNLTIQWQFVCLVYKKGLADLEQDSASSLWENKIKQKGRARVLIWTRVAIRTYKMLGTDVVGMSTAPEVIVVAYSGLKLLGILCITNYTTGFKEEINHEEVIEVTECVKGDFKGLLKAVFAELLLC